MLFIAVHRNIYIASPIRQINTLSNVLMKSGVRPIYNTSYQSMFQRIHMYVVDMVLIVQIVTNGIPPVVMPQPYSRSPAAYLISERRSVFGKAREKPLLIKCQRILKLLSFGGNVQTQCKWSGNTTHASIWKRWRLRTRCTVSRSKLISRINKLLSCRCNRLTVKK